MKTATRIVPRHGYADYHSNQLVRLTMPVPPFPIPDGPDETAPRQPMIKCDFDWQKKDSLLRYADRVLR